MKKILSFLTVLIFVFSGLLVYQKSVQLIEKENKSVNQIKVSQSLTKKNSPVKYSTFNINKDKTALDLLKQTAKIKTKGDGINAYVVDINGYEAKSESKEYWAFYVNDKPAEVGAGSYKLKSGDKIEWKIEKY